MRPFWRIFALGVLIVVIGVAWALQRQVAGELRGTIQVLREQNQEVGRLRAEGRRLRETQISLAELERLRADQAAVSRLQGEVEAARTRIIELERAEAAERPDR